MENIFVLPTTQPSRLWINNLLQGKLELSKETLIGSNTAQHMYITSDEDLILGGFHFNSKYGDEPQKTDQRDIDSRKYWEEEYYYISKIILTTDPTLIEDGVQAIDDEFLKWFVKNPTCEFVEVKKQEVILGNYDAKGLKKIYDDSYKIIIPQEEPKQEKEEEYFKHLEKDKKEFAKEWEEIRQEFGFDKKEETLEEAAEKRIPTNTHIWELTETRRCDFIAGAKWQAERMFNEKDLRNAYFSAIKTTGEGWNGEYAEGNSPNIEEKFNKEFEEWLKQFKKK